MSRQFGTAIGAAAIIALTSFAVGAQSSVKTYPAQAVAWQLQDKQDFTNPAHISAFLNVSTDADDHIYVANLISVLVVNAKTGKVERAIHDKTNTLIQYQDVEAAGDGNVWVADEKTGIVYLLDPNGNILNKIALKNADGTTTDVFTYEIAVGPDGNLYAEYSGDTYEIQVYQPDGTFVRTIQLDHDFTSTADLAFGPDGNLYALGNGVIRIFDPQGNVVVKNFAEDIFKPNQAARNGIAIDHNGNVYVGAAWRDATSKQAMGAIYKLDKTGALIAQFGAWQPEANYSDAFKPDEFTAGISMATLSDGSLVIANMDGVYSQLVKVNMQG